tara:strand:- start:1939 stop:2103 length:165 start_codon:yes stop_codon:yes gene_type:complete
MKKAETKLKEKSKPSIPEVIENLKAQINQYQTMLIKAQGALEVLTQLEDTENDG